MNGDTKKLKLKRDGYMSARGGTSAFLNIYCARCRRWLLLYQKDGPGTLFRLYLDRIHAPEDLKKTKGLTCGHCNTSIGVPMVYKPENRQAFRLIPGAIVRKKSNGVLPAPETADPKGDTDESPES